MKKVQIRQISLLLAALTAAGTMLACGETAGQNSTDTAADTEPQTEVTTIDPYIPDLPEDLNYDGYVFRIWSRYDDPSSMYSSETTGDIMDDAVYERNLKVAEALNIEFESLVDPDNLYGTGAKNAMMANEDAYDVVIPHARFVFSTYAMNGLCLDWQDLKYIDLDKPYWYQDARKSFTICGRLFGMVGDIDYDCLGRTKCMYFNKKLLQDFDLDSPYELVNSGKWTMDVFEKMVRSVKQDLNGDGKIEIENDQLGYGTTWWGGPINVLYAGNQRVCDLDEDGQLVLTMNTPKTVELFDKYFALFDGEDCFLNCSDQGGAVVGDAFKQGRLFIQDGTLSSAEGLRDMEIDFGIIPWPKLDESEDAYRTGVDAGCNMLLVPVCATDPDRTSVILELMCYEGYKTIIPAYYDIALETKASRDEDSAAMIDLIRESGLFDVGYYCETNTKFLGSCGRVLSERPDHNFASYYAEVEAFSQGVLDKINKYFSELE